MPEIEDSVCPDCPEKGPGWLSFACPVTGEVMGAQLRQLQRAGRLSHVAERLSRQRDLGWAIASLPSQPNHACCSTRILAPSRPGEPCQPAGIVTVPGAKADVVHTGERGVPWQLGWGSRAADTGSTSEIPPPSPSSACLTCCPLVESGASAWALWVK